MNVEDLLAGNEVNPGICCLLQRENRNIRNKQKWRMKGIFKFFKKNPVYI